MFEAPKLTNAGKALYYRNLGGEALKITTMQLGDGQLSTPIATLTGLVHSVVSIDAAVNGLCGGKCQIFQCRLERRLLLARGRHLLCRPGQPE